MVRQRFHYASPNVSNTNIAYNAVTLTPLLMPKHKEIFHLYAYRMWLQCNLAPTDFNNIGNTLDWTVYLIANPHMEGVGDSLITGTVEGHHRAVLDTWTRQPVMTGENAAAQEHFVEAELDTGWCYTNLPLIGVWMLPVILTADNSSGHRFGATIEYESERVTEDEWIGIASLYGFDGDVLLQQRGRLDLTFE